MFKMICKLQQLTPMIHFQADETGACLRASEVKPKLDKFIRSRKNDIPKDWYIYGEKAKETDIYALDYKLKFEAAGTPEIKINQKGEPGKKGTKEINQSFFGVGKTVMYNEPILMTVICFIPDLLECIKESAEIFFVMHNFGTRQNKGFGSFIVSEIDGKATSWESKNYPELIKDFTSGLYYEYKTVKNAKENVLENIRMIYGLMKSGWNFTKIKDSDGIRKFPDDYFKGFIFRYFMEKYPEVMNDKKFIKTKLHFKNEKIVNRAKVNENAVLSDHQKAYFYRALLGLPGYYEFKDEERKGTVNVKSAEIHRFHSPLLWTLAGRYLIAIPQKDGLDIILNRKFEFIGPGESNSGVIDTPATFEIEDFLESFCKDFNDKKTYKGGTIGLENAKYKSLSDIKKVQLNMLKDVN